MATPEIGAGLRAQQGLIFNQLLLEKHARLKGVEAQHALTEAVDGKDRGLVHLPLGQHQPARRLLLIGNIVKQASVERIGAAFTQTGDT